MTAIFTGLGSGFVRSSASALGNSGLLGSASTGRGGDSVTVNAATGNLVISRQDEFLVGRGPDLAISRTYNSLAEVSDGDNGDQWQMGTARRVFGFTGTLNTAGSTVKRVSEDGSVVTYAYGTRGGVAAYWTTDGDGAHDKLVKSGTTWIWTDGTSQLTETYEASVGDAAVFRIKEQADTDGNKLTFAYGAGTDKLDRVTTQNNGTANAATGVPEQSYVQYTWSGNNISQIVTGYTDFGDSATEADNLNKTLTRTRYAYDASNRLITVTVDLSPGDNSIADGKTYVTSYTYDGSSKRVASITQTDGSSLSITYDGSGRVATLTQAVATGDTRLTTLSYGTNYTTVTGPDNQVTRLDYDGAKQLTKITAPPAYSGATAQTVQFGYDADGNVASVTDGAGKVTSYTYDAMGNVLTSTDPNSDVVTRTYGARNELLTETRTGSDASGAAVSHTTHYVYDGENHLRYTVSPEGHVTEYLYSVVGTPTLVIAYPEHRYDVAGPMSEGALYTWRSALPDRSSTAIRQYYYDGRDNLVYAIDYGYAIATGGGATSEGYKQTNFTYDQAGKLLSRLVATQSLETFVYDGLGRLVASTDVVGETTSIVFNDAALTTTVTTGAGRTSVSSYNKAGDLVGETHSGSYDVTGSASYLYDRNGRLRVATDATGYKSYYLYDKAGRKIADINHYGHVTEYRYDAAGRVAASISYTNALTAEQITALGDPNNAIEMASIRPAGHGYDIWSWSIYDGGGRLIESIDGDGGVAVFSYDASDRLVKTVSYYNKLSGTQLTAFKTTAPAASVLPTANAAKDAVSRTFYDRDGRTIGTLDGEGYLTETVYDEAGRKVEEVAYAAITSSSYWAAGTLDQLRASAVPTSGSNRRMHYVYDGQSLLRYTVDNAGYVTQYQYRGDTLYEAVGLLRGTIVLAAPISTTDFTYDNVKALVAAIASDANDRESYSVCNAKGQVAYAVDAGGQVTGFTYDAAGRVTRTVQYAVLRGTPSLPTVATMNTWAAGQAGNAANRVTRNWYTAGGDLRFSVDAEGYIRRYDYDAEGRLTREVTWANAVTATDATTIAQAETLTASAGTWTDVRYTYDAAGRRNSVYDGEGNRTVYSWYANGALSSVYYAYGTADQSRTLYVNDGAGRTKAEYFAYGEAEQAVVQYAYDGLGNQVSVTDANGKVTNYAYDERGQVLTMTDAANGVTTYEYNAFGEVVKATDPRGNSTYSYYDTLGRVTLVRDAESYLTETTYTAFGEVDTVTRRYNKTASPPSTTTPPTVTAHAKDATTNFDYDKLGRVTKITDAEGFFESYTYNAFGERAAAANKLGATTTYGYDRRGLKTSEVLPMSSVNTAGTTVASTVTNTFQYDARGNLKVETRAAGLAEQTVTTYEYDKANRLIHTTGQTFHGVTPHTYYAYDARGNLTGKTDPNGYRTIYYYDDLDRVSVEIDAGGTYTAYVYDPNGNVTSIRVYGTVVAVPADGGSQEEQPAAPSGNYRETTFAYDNLNRMLSSSVQGVVTGSWNGSSWVSATGALTTQYVYDASGNVAKTIDPNGNATWAWYDTLGRKTDQIDALGYRTGWSYDAESNVLQEYRYWNAGATPSAGASPPIPLPALPATHANDRITDYTYDRMGNRKSEARRSVAVHDGSGGTSTVTAQILYTYNGLGEVTRKTEATGDYVDYAYDTSGRLTQETRSGFTDHTGATVTPVTEYRYDGLGNLTRTRQVGNATAADRVTTYGYDGGKLRWMADAEFNDGTTTDGKQTWYYYDAAGNLQYEYYNRRTSTGVATADYEGTYRVYDGMGRVSQQYINYNIGGTWYQNGPTTFTTYDAYGEVASVQVGTGALQQNQYDKAGRLVASNAGDGVWKYFGYDRNGNQTVALTSAGYGSFTGTTDLATALARAVGYADANASYTTYDARNLATQVIEEGRELTGSGTQTLTTTRTYNPFGEVASETDAAGATTTYTYNTMGRTLRAESPTVSMTLEDGTSRWIKPSVDYYYDAGGRLVATRDANGTYATGGTSANGTSKAANTGNLTRLTLLAGTGYGGSQALVTQEIHADSGIKQTLYDVHGDARIIRDELYAYTGLTTANDSLHFIEQSFDQMGRIEMVKQERSIDTSLTDDSTRLIDYYQYDGLGQQLKHYNSYYGSTNAEVTEYDIQGRVISSRAFGGDMTTTTYAWDSTIGGFGGWTETTTMANSRVAVEQTDIFGRIRYKNDLADGDLGVGSVGHVFSYTYDAAGRLSSITQGSATQTYAYFNTGKLKQIAIANAGAGSTPATTYGYDVTGNLTAQSTYDSSVGQTQTLTAAYDLLGRMTAWTEAGNATTPAASSTLSYDAKGNIRRVSATFYYLDSQGVAGTLQASSDLWYRYDSMDRVVISKGQLVSGQIVQGTAITYNAAGQRTTVTTRSANLTWTGWSATTPGSGLVVYVDDPSEYEWDGYHWIHNGVATYTGKVVESYSYTANGLLDQVSVASERAYANGTAFVTASGTMGSSVLRANFDYDAMGRVTLQEDIRYTGSGTDFSRAVTYDSAGRIVTDNTNTLRGTTIYANNTTNTYLTGTSNMLGAANYSRTVTLVGGSDSAAPDTRTDNTYAWGDSAMQTTLAYKPDAGGSTVYTTSYTYNAFAQLTSVYVGDGRPHTITFRNSADGQLIRRDEADGVPANGDPHDVYYRMGGKQLGKTGNNGTADVSYLDSTARRTATQGTGAFMGGLSYGSAYADFGLDYDAINSFSQGGDGGLYQVQSGDTLQGIAQNLWGDASLWYKLAEANGLSASSTLQAGRSLTIPTGVQRVHNNASTMKPYDPAEAIGDTSPTTPKAPKKAKCGSFGMIMLAVVAVAVATIATAGAASLLSNVAFQTVLGGMISGTAVTGVGMGAWIAGGAIGGAAGSMASQGLGVATGIQDKFSWKGVALAGIGGAVGGALSGVNPFNEGALGNVTGAANAAVRGALGSAVTQGIGVATGLQNKFSWAGVAAAGVGAGVSFKLAPNLTGSGRSFGDIMTRLGVSAASSIAGAATRSAIEGTSFGRNIMAGLPDVIGQAIGSALAGGLAGGGRSASGGSGRLAIEEMGDIPIANAVSPEQLTAQLEAIAAQTSVSPVARSGQVTIGESIAGAVETTSAVAQSSTYANAVTGAVEHVGSSHNEVEWIAARSGDPMTSAAGDVEGFLGEYGHETTLQMLLKNAPDARVTSDQLFSLAGRVGSDSATAALASAFYADSGLLAQDVAFDSLLGRGDFALNFPAGEQMDPLQWEAMYGRAEVERPTTWRDGSFYHFFDNFLYSGYNVLGDSLSFPGALVAGQVDIPPSLGGGAVSQSASIAATSLRFLRFGAAETTAPEFVTVFRGDRAGTTIIKSNAAREGGYASSQRIIDSNNLDDLFQSHALDSSSPASPFISVTTDPNVARYFAGPNGVVNEFRIPVSRATPNPFNNYVVPAGPGGQLVPEAELLVPNYIRPSEFVRRP